MEDPKTTPTAKSEEEGEPGGLFISLKLLEWIELEVAGETCRVILRKTKKGIATLQIKAHKTKVKINRWNQKKEEKHEKG